MELETPLFVFEIPWPLFHPAAPTQLLSCTLPGGSPAFSSFPLPLSHRRVSSRPHPAVQPTEEHGIRTLPFPGRARRETCGCRGEFFPDGYSCAAPIGIPLADSRQLVPLRPAGCCTAPGAGSWRGQSSAELLLMVLGSHRRERPRGVKESPLCSEITWPVFCGSSY